MMHLEAEDRVEQAFAALTKQAQDFGTSVKGLAPGLESFEAALTNIDRTAKGFVALKAEDLPGASLAKNVDATTTAYGNFIKLLRAGRQTQDEAEKTAKAFFDTMKDGATLTSAALKALPIGTLNEIKTALGGGGLTNRAFFEAIDQGTISIDKLQQALIAFGPQAQKAFDTKAIVTLGEEVYKAWHKDHRRDGKPHYLGSSATEDCQGAVGCRCVCRPDT